MSIMASVLCIPTIWVVAGVVGLENSNFTNHTFHDEILSLSCQKLAGRCSGFFPFNPCYCDEMCFWYQDCCRDHSLHTSSPDSDLFDYMTIFPNRSHLECLQPCIETGCTCKKYFMITKCSHTWKARAMQATEKFIVQLCEESPFGDSPPATDNFTGISYKNKYCGLCNNVANNQLIVWVSKWNCDERIKVFLWHSLSLTSQTFKSYCHPLSFTPPEPSSGILKARQCDSSYVTTCPETPPANLPSTVDYSTLMANCSRYSIEKLVSSQGNFYSNPYCAICNTAKVGRWVNSFAINFPLIYFGRMKLTFFFNSLSENTISYDGNSVAVNTTLTCPNGTVYYPYAESNCKAVYFNHTALYGNSNDNCTFIALTKIEYVLFDSITVQRLGDNLIYPIVGMNTENEPIICVNLTEDHPEVITSDAVGIHSVALEVLSYCGLALNIISGVFILFTYCVYRELQTLYGKLLLNMATIVAIGDLVLAIAHSTSASTNSQPLCTTLAILIHYTFLARFFSCSALFSEAARTFYSALKVIPESDGAFKGNCLYLSIYLVPAYSVSAAITAVCVILHFTLEGSVGYGFQLSTCWMNNITAISVAFVTPLGLSLIFNIIAFVFCTCAVIKLTLFLKDQQESNMWQNILMQNFRVITAIIAVSGVLWIVLAFILIPGTDGKGQRWGRYFFVVLNGCQLTLVAIAYVCSKRMMNHYIQSARSTFSQFIHHPSPTHQTLPSTSNSVANTKV